MQTTLIITMDTVAAASNAVRQCTFRQPGKWRILSAYLEPDVNVSAHASNTTDLKFLNGSTELANHDTDSGADGALTAQTAVDFTPAEGLGRYVTDGDALRFTKTDAASGQAFSGSLVITLEKQPVP